MSGKKENLMNQVVTRQFYNTSEEHVFMFLYFMYFGEFSMFCSTARVIFQPIFNFYLRFFQEMFSTNLSVT